MTLGEKIDYYRDKKGWTQKALAERMGITPTRLNYWEKDKREPDVKMLNLLCRTLDDNPKVLLSDEEIEKAPAPSEDSAGENGKLGRDDVVKVLMSLGFIYEGEDLSDSDLLFLEGVVNILEAWFEQRRQGV